MAAHVDDFVERRFAFLGLQGRREDLVDVVLRAALLGRLALLLELGELALELLRLAVKMTWRIRILPLHNYE